MLCGGNGPLHGRVPAGNQEISLAATGHFIGPPRSGHFNAYAARDAS